MQNIQVVHSFSYEMGLFLAQYNYKLATCFSSLQLAGRGQLLLGLFSWSVLSLILSGVTNIPTLTTTIASYHGLVSCCPSFPLKPDFF